MTQPASKRLVTEARLVELADDVIAPIVADSASATAGAMRAVFRAQLGDAWTRQAATAAALGAHLWVDVNAAAYQRDGLAVTAASVITHDTPTSRPYIALNPETANDIAATSGGAEGVIGSGGALPTGWTLVNASGATVTVQRVSTDGSFDVELMATIPPLGSIGYTSPDIALANDFRHITFNLTLAATDLQYVSTTVGWNIGAGVSEIVGGGGGQITAEIAGSSSATDKMKWLFKNNHTTAPITVRALVKNVSVYKPAVAGGLRRDVQPVGVLAVRDATVSVPAGTYHVFAWTEGRGIVTERVTVAGSSFSLRTVIGNGRITKLAVWRVADYTDGMLDILEPPAWEVVDEFDTAHLEKMSDQITSAAKMRYQAPGNPWNVQVAVNRFSRSRAEVRSGEYMVTDTVAPVAYANSYQRRAEVYSGTAFPYDTDLWVSFSFRTSNVMSDPNSYGLIWQWLDAAAPGDLIKLSPSCSLQMRENGQLGLYTISTTDPNPAVQPAAVLRWLGRYVVGSWNDVVLRTRFSQSGGGKLGMWFNGVEVYAWQDTAVGANKPTGVQPHYGFYGGQSRETIVVDRANVEFGTRDLSARVTAPLPI